MKNWSYKGILWSVMSLIKNIYHSRIQQLKTIIAYTKSTSKISSRSTESNVKENDPSWLKKAFEELGVAEIPGDAENPRITEYHTHTTLKSKTEDTAWCSAFINWCIQTVGIRGTRKANARSWVNWGYPMDKPERGCVCVLWRVSPKDWRGHVGLFIKEDDHFIYLLGGNQSNKVCIKKYNKNRILAYRWPKGV